MRDAPGWAEVLDLLEADARDELSAEAADWHPPADLGPLPPELIDRARAVLALQRARAADLAGRRSSVAAELAAVRAVPTDERASVYLDTSG
ncbi:hypothetical protein CLV46_2880 [Diaminobutyricimonas aerilata]|uniref:Uncharacterized protein n=1 Tax=Diaminobutyricimonas aerilata TaxID=1162967 RepID=A0A2M9CN62_9MICO|nr:hypothetical protein [Diaminobutyricimonas aerilata]PJJ73294.1 hypothetical protein CLV46_2880 [Diaminobutyricimonas aerilata]